MISFVFSFFLRKFFRTRSTFGKILMECISIFLTIALVYYGSESFEFKNQTTAEQTSLFTFLIVGEVALILPMSFSERMISYFLEIRSQHFFQTLIGLKLSPEKYVLSRSMVDVVFPFLRIMIIFAICSLALNFKISFSKIMMFFVIEAIALLLFLLMALITNLLYLKFNRGHALYYSVQTFAAILGGLYFPINIFPGPLKNIAEILPQTQILRASREIFQSNTLTFSSFFLLILWLVFLVSGYTILRRFLITDLKKKALYF